jgi:transcriptional regulator with GAF, ATPase, and Fis domain
MTTKDLEHTVDIEPVRDVPEARGLASMHDTGSSDGQDLLAQSFSEFSRSLETMDDPHSTLVEIVRAAVELIPGCDDGSVSVVRGRHKVTSEAASGPLPEVVDRLQEELREGPCIDAAYLHTTIRASDLSTDPRWPTFTPRALAAGAAGMLSFQLYVDNDDMGALNLFSRVAGAFDDDSEHIGRMFATHAAIAFSAARKESYYSNANQTRELIGQAQGILMERHKVTSDQAFALLIRVSQQQNKKLREIAEQLVHSGALPGTR